MNIARPSPLCFLLDTTWYIKQISNKIEPKTEKPCLLSQWDLSHPNMATCPPRAPTGHTDRGAAHFLRAEAGDDQEITLALQQGIHLQQNPEISPTKTWQMLSNCVGFGWWVSRRFEAIVQTNVYRAPRMPLMLS